MHRGLNAPDCFLCAGKPSLVLGVTDPRNNSSQDVGVCDFCYTVICGSKDQEVAHLWFGMKEALAAGLTDAGLWHNLSMSFNRVGGGLTLLTAPTSSGGLSRYLLAYTAPLQPQVSPFRLWCRSRMPLPASGGDYWERLCENKVWRLNVPIDNERYFIDSEFKPKIEKISSFQSAMYSFATKIYGDPPDILRNLVEAETEVGYELFRRGLL